MSGTRKYLSAVAVAAGLVIAAGAAAPSQAQTIGEGLVMYFQMGGNPGGGATLARTNGARAAAEAFGVDLREQYSAWQPDVMINQFKEAIAGNPDCIEIMGHPGNDAFLDLAAEARERGIVLTSGNSQLSDLFNEYRQSGFGFVGMDNYRSGRLVAGATIKNAGLQEGDRVMVYGLLSQDERGKLERGALDVYEENNMTIDYIEISPGGERRPVARRADPRRLYRAHPRCEVDHHVAWHGDRIPGQGPPGSRQGAPARSSARVTTSCPPPSKRCRRAMSTCCSTRTSSCRASCRWFSACCQPPTPFRASTSTPASA